MTPASGSNKQRYAWVDFAKGICIVAVVTYYAKYLLTDQFGHAGWLDEWTAFARPFRMPDFFLISGLFLSRVIDRPWRSYLDTKVVHYLYFLVLWTLIIAPWTWLSVPWEVTPWSAFKNILYHLYRPEAMLWFIQMLAVYFVISKLLRGVPWWMVISVGALLKIFPYHTGIYPVDWFGEYFVFFFTGYVFAQSFFTIADWTQSHRPMAIALVVIWVIFNTIVVFSGWSNIPLVFLALGMVGICAVVIVSSLLSRYPFMSWLSYLGENSIVVYLGFYLPMQLALWGAASLQLAIAPGILGAVVTVTSIFCAMCLFWGTQSTWAEFLFRRPSWARLRIGDREAAAT